MVRPESPQHITVSLYSVVTSRRVGHVYIRADSITGAEITITNTPITHTRHPQRSSNQGIRRVATACPHVPNVKGAHPIKQSAVLHKDGFQEFRASRVYLFGAFASVHILPNERKKRREKTSKWRPGSLQHTAYRR